MVDAMRAMLDELMGKERNLPPEERTGKGISYKDAEICKYALAGLCPYGLFKNTKSDLGLCKYEVHEDDVEFPPAKEEWDKLEDSQKERYGYRRELLGLLQQLVRDMDRKIERQRDRAAKESENRIPTPQEQSQLDDLKILSASKQMQRQEKDLQRQSEETAEQGNVDASMNFANQAEALSKQQAELYKQFTTPERTMSVCDVCGVFINSTDSDQRKADHLAGKQYLGWQAIRDKFKEFEKDEEGRKASRSQAEPKSREREREKERPRERDRDRERDRHRERDSRSKEDRHRSSRSDRDRSDRHRSDRERDRRRSRSRERLRGTEVPPPDSLYNRGGSRRERDQ